MNKHKKFIKDCYNGKHGNICSEWKQTILNHYPEFEENKLEVGKWYKCNEHATLWFITGYNGYMGTGYGLLLGDWIDSCNTILINKDRFNWKPATEQEVFEALKNEAVKRGFKDGVRYYNAHFNNKIDKSDIVRCGDYFRFHFDFHSQLCSGKGTIFIDGQWAEIVSKKKMTLKEVEKELGYEIEITE